MPAALPWSSGQMQRSWPGASESGKSVSGGENHEVSFGGEDTIISQHCGEGGEGALSSL